MNYAYIVDGKVWQLIEDAVADQDLLAEDGTVEVVAGAPIPLARRFHADFLAQVVPAPDGVKMGNLYDGKEFTNAPEPVALVAQSVTKRQAVLALFDAGKLDAVNAAIDAAGARARAEWEASATVERQSPLVLQLGQALGLDLDALFTAAVAL